MKIFVTATLLFLISLQTLAQTPAAEVSVASLRGVFCVAPGTKMSRAGIRINIPAYTADVVSFRVDWGDGTDTYPVNYPKSSKDTSHILENDFDLGDCLYDQEFLIRVTTSFTASSGKADWRTPTSVFFTNPPTATIVPNPNPACIGQRVDYSIKLCPSDQVKSSIFYGNGTPEESKSSHDYFSSFSQKGTFSGVLKLENVCNVGAPISIAFTTTVIDRAVPVMKADSGITREINKDTLLVCLSNGKATVKLNGKESVGATEYFWYELDFNMFKVRMIILRSLSLSFQAQVPSLSVWQLTILATNYLKKFIRQLSYQLRPNLHCRN